MLPTILIGFVVLLLVVGSYVKHRDTFHPAMFIGPMLGFHYCYSPLVLFSAGGFFGYLTEDMVTRAQWVHLAGVIALCLGVFLGAPVAVTPTESAKAPGDAFDRTTLFRASLIFASMGIASFVYGIGNVGGFSEAYGSAYGGGWSNSGWIRDQVLLCIPALMLLTLSYRNDRVTLSQGLIAIVYASPFLVHGLLGGRRGPTFMAFVGITMAFYMARAKRLRFPTLAIGGAVLGVLMLFLVSNRQSLYWGSDKKADVSASDYFRPSAGNDFIYGAGLVIVTDEMQNFSWGATYLTTFFVRPIPRSIWPTKYEDAARFFGNQNLDEGNLGIDIRSFHNIVGWTATFGAAPGIVGDMWREFSWGMVVVLCGIGWFYGYVWRRAVSDGRSWLPVYCFLASLSLYLVMQTLEAMLYRFVFAVFPMLWALHRAARNLSDRTPIVLHHARTFTDPAPPASVMNQTRTQSS